MKPSTLLVPVHEREALRHRIIIFTAAGVPSAGDWYPSNELAINGQYFACAEPCCALPPGIFTVRSVPHQELRA